MLTAWLRTRPQGLRRALLAAADAIAFPLALWLGACIRLGTWKPPIEDWGLVLALSPIVGVAVFFASGLYREIIRYLGLHLAVRLGQAVVITSAILISVTFFVDRGEGISRVAFIPFALVALLLTGGIRVGARHLIWSMKSEARRRIVIYGAGEAGAGLASALSQDLSQKLVAFIDDDPRMRGASIRGARVHAPDKLESLVRERRVDVVLLALPSANKRRRREIGASLRHLPVTVLTVPTLAEIADGTATVDELRPIALEDLLGRPPVEPDAALLDACIAGKSVLVTGAGGSIGSELCRQIVRHGPRRVVLLERSEFALYEIERELARRIENDPALGGIELVARLGDVCDRVRLSKLLREYETETVYHAAAYKHVPIVEHNEIEGVRNNAIGTLHAAEAALAAGVGMFVLISTDKAVRPTNVMGASKRFAEMILQAMQARDDARKTRFSMVRFGNVLGSSGSVVPLFEKQIREGGPVTVTHPDVTRFFMTIPEAAELVVQAGSMSLAAYGGRGGEVFVLDMGDPVRIADLARNMVRLAGRTLRDEGHPDGDIELRFTGLRPGEKLYEELLIGEDCERTEHPGIMRAREEHLDWDALNVVLHRLEAAIDQQDARTVRALLAETVTGYRPGSNAPTARADA